MHALNACPDTLVLCPTYEAGLVDLKLFWLSGIRGQRDSATYPNSSCAVPGIAGCGRALRHIYEYYRRPMCPLHPVREDRVACFHGCGEAGVSETGVVTSEVGSREVYEE